MAVMVLLLILLAGASGAAEWHVGPGQPFATVQAAVNAAAAGDLILVHDAVYHEHVVVHRRVTLRSLDYHLHGENDGAVVDAGFAPGFGIYVSAPGAVVEGFTIKGAAGEGPLGYFAGLCVDGAQGCRIAANRCDSNATAMTFLVADDLVVEGNQAAWGKLGFYVDDCSGGTWRGNVARDVREEADSAGFLLVGSEEKDVVTTERNLLIANVVSDCNVGIGCERGAARNTVRENVVADCWVGIYLDEGTGQNVIADNMLRDHGSRGLHLNGAHHNTIAGNWIENCATGVWLGHVDPVDEGSDHNVITGNTIAGSGEFGLRASSRCEGNRIFLNAFVENATHVYVAGEAVWWTPTVVSYFHDAVNHANSLGNHYDTYDGVDVNGDGVGDTGLIFRDGDAAFGPVELRPLVSPLAAYFLQAWYLGAASPLALRHGEPAGAIGDVQLPANGSVVWPTPVATPVERAFPSGSWRGRLRFLGSPAAGQIRLEVGTWTASTGFQPAGLEAVASDGDWEATFVTGAAVLVVPAGHHLAVRLVNGGDAAAWLWGGGASGYVTSPGNGDPLWREVETGVAPPPAISSLRLRAAPNPFNPRTTFRFDLASEQRVSLRVHDLAGRLVRTLVPSGSLPSGTHELVWDGRDDGGRAVASGAYLARLAGQDGAAAAVVKVLLLR